MLPKPANSVEHAHHILMPSEVKKAILNNKEVLRSGELFLVEVTEEEDEFITEKIKDELLIINRVHFLFGNTVFTYTHKGEKHTCDHVPYIFIHSDKSTFVSLGMGNARHFVAIDGWFRVVPNTELPPPPQTAQRAVFD